MNRNGQWELDGLLMGPGTLLPVSAVNGLGVPDPKVHDRDAVIDDGFLAGDERMGSREVVMEIGVDGDIDQAAYGTLLDSLGAAFVPRSTDVVLRYQRFNRIRRMYVRPRGLVLPWDDDFILGAAKATGRLLLPDPVVYDDEVTTVALPVGTTVVTNAGNWAVWPTITTTSGAAITITNSTTGLHITLGARSGSTVIDFKRRTAIAGVTDVYSAVGVNPQWWKLQPGNNSIAVTAAASISYRHGYAMA